MAQQKMSLTVKVLIGMGLGIVVGLAINLLKLNAEGFINEYMVNGLFNILGQIFINGLKMLVVPLVFFSLITGVLGISDVKALGRVGAKAFGLYILTTAFAIVIAISISILLGIGQGIEMESTSSFSVKEAPPLSEIFINIVPSNVVNAMADGNMLQIIFFSIMVGISILLVGKKAQPVVELIEISNAIMIKMVNLIMRIAPYAVFALLAKALADLGLDLLVDLAAYVVVLIGILMIHLFVTLMIVFKIFSGLNPVTFLKKMYQTQIFAFSTSSSNATIPVTLRTVTNKLGINNSVASFIVPFGATINMDGTAIMQGVTTVFIANIYGIDLGLSGYLTVILMSVLASIGTAGVPGVGLIMLSMVFTQVGLPIEGIGLVLGIDRLLDMVRTAVNVTGDAAVSVIVGKSENKFRKRIFNDPKAGTHDDDDVRIDQNVEKEIADFIEPIDEE